MAKWPTGIKPRGRGIEIELWRHGKRAYSEIIQGDPHKKADLTAAVNHRNKLKARLELGLPLFVEDTGHRTFEMVAQKYLNTLDADPRTIREYYNQLALHWEPVFSGWPIHEITTAAVKDALADIDLAQKTKKNILIPLSGVFGYAGIIPNPAHGVKFGKRQKAQVERYKPEDRDKVLSKLGGQYHVYFALLFATGLRPGEACALEWSDWDGEQLHVCKQITKGNLKDRTKTFKNRDVYVPQWVRPILLNHSTRFEGGYIFKNTQGNPYSQTRYLNKAWAKAHKDARIRLRTPYTCRHTRAAELLSMGIGAADAASQLGHSAQVFLNTYSEFIIEYSDQQDFSRFEPQHKHHTKTEKMP
jgi:integrase|tara:strand:- start:293 stop:1369 length:1077 start_codon:yes stop_codon:yes gene_type:complete